MLKQILVHGPRRLQVFGVPDCLVEPATQNHEQTVGDCILVVSPVLPDDSIVVVHFPVVLHYEIVKPGGRLKILLDSESVVQAHVGVG